MSWKQASATLWGRGPVPACGAALGQSARWAPTAFPAICGAARCASTHQRMQESHMRNIQPLTAAQTGRAGRSRCAGRPGGSACRMYVHQRSNTSAILSQARSAGCLSALMNSAHHDLRRTCEAATHAGATRPGATTPTRHASSTHMYTHESAGPGNWLQRRAVSIGPGAGRCSWLARGAATRATRAIGGGGGGGRRAV